MIHARALLGSHDVLLLVLDTLRFDVARDCMARGETPKLQALLAGGQWERRHAPGNFTYSSHQAFFAGFLPTPAHPGRHPRLFALDFEGSETRGEQTCVFDAPDIVRGFAGAGYHTLCIGGVGFFNKRNALGRVLPDLFAESHWEPELGVTDPDSTGHQVELARQRMAILPAAQRLFLFLNVSALHQPNHHHLDGASEDSLESHAAALRYVDAQLPPLFSALQRRGPSLCVICSDHGTAYGEEGYRGHRAALPCIWEVPYAEFVLPAELS